MKMNLRRGFFRIWVVVSIAFAGAVGVLGYEKVAGEFERAGPWPGILMVPVDCRDARGNADKDYTTGLDGSWCWYQVDVLRKLYPEYKDLSDEAVGDRLYKKANIMEWLKNIDGFLNIAALATMVVVGFIFFWQLLSGRISFIRKNDQNKPPGKSN